MKYLAEHVTEILSAIRHSGDLLLQEGASWETTAWARSMADAARLAEELREKVFAELDRAERHTEACIGLVRATGGAEPLRWGVLVRLARR